MNWNNLNIPEWLYQEHDSEGVEARDGDDAGTGLGHHHCTKQHWGRNPGNNILSQTTFYLLYRNFMIKKMCLFLITNELINESIYQ